MSEESFFPQSEPAPCAGINQRLVGKRQQFVVERIVKMRAEVVGGPPKRRAQVGAANVADEQRIAR